MKGRLLIILGVFTQMATAQFIDNFADGDFTVNPTWSGDNSNYEVDTFFQVHLNAPAQTDTSYLSTSSVVIDNAIWEVFVQMDFNPSSANYAKIYLVADQANLSGALNGYFVKVGNTADEISLYRQAGLLETKIIDGIDARVNTNPVNVTIQVKRDQLGNWQVLSDTTGGVVYVLEGTCFDNSYVSSSFFGFSSRYTSTRSTKFYYDNINISGTGFVDSIPPKLDSLIVVDSNSLALYFNETVDINTAEALTSYLVDLGIGIPSNAVRDLVDSSLVSLIFSAPFINGQSYNLAISNVEDTLANAVISIDSSFTYLFANTPNTGEVIINEIFVDPTPQIGLPAAEFVELYNTSNTFFILNNWQFINTNTIKLLPNIILNPNSYIILCDINDTGLYSSYGDVIGINSFTSLTNGGDSLSLMDDNNNVIDVVNYNMSWYQDNLKEDGGWTLERINPRPSCDYSINWMASAYPMGGTPGLQNSVFDTLSDIQAPVISSININSINQISIVFNESMDSISIENATYDISGGISGSVMSINSNPDEVSLVLTQSLDSSVFYNVKINGARDCSGNLMSVDNIFNFVLPQIGFVEDVVINEVLFNPYVGGSDFVEIYNKSNKIIDVQDWSLANLENDSINNYKKLSNLSKYLLPGNFLILTKDAQNISEEYINTVNNSLLQMISLPTYNNEEGAVYLINNLDMVVDSFHYDEEMHFSLLNNVKGVSLERIDYERLSRDKTNWHSAAEAVGFATPGYENSQYLKANINDENVIVAPKTFSPDNDGIDDVVNISYHFSKSGFVANIVIYDAKGTRIKNLVQNELLGTSGTFSWDGINENNTKAKIGIYIIYIQAFNLKGEVNIFKKTVVLASYL